MRSLPLGLLSIFLVGSSSAGLAWTQESNRLPADTGTPTCIDWARGPTISEDRRLISIFSNQALSGQLYQSFNMDNPPIASPERVRQVPFGGAPYRSSTYVFDLFDLPKDEFESTNQYLARRRAFWSDLLGEDGHVMHIGHRRLSFTYNADTEAMRVNSNYTERHSTISDSPKGLQFSDNLIERDRWTVINRYFVQTNNDLFGRMESDTRSAYAPYQPLIIPMDGEAARDVNASGFLKLKLRLPIFTSLNQPVAMRNSTPVMSIRTLGHSNSIYADLECAVLVTAGGRYFDLLAVR